MDECGHARLHLMSGGYYLGCVDCGKRWVAIDNSGPDTAVDRKGRFGSMIQTYFEYALTAIPKAR